MTERVLKWIGIILVAATAVSMAIYFYQIELDEADKTASVVGVFVGLAGLALAIYGTVTERNKRINAAQLSESTPASEPEKTQFGSINNNIMGGSFFGPVIQGRDIEVSNHKASQQAPPSSSNPPQTDETQDSDKT
ncbi:hypothetical protein [Streptosporangium minutum]|uniref:hypothetical protein n=1 Tax=Streptosporangium minutum TaxID=569862 RepID=UPI00105512F6|nr:hypothetical protein [Streptosporangium minutum]